MTSSLGAPRGEDRGHAPGLLPGKRSPPLASFTGTALGGRAWSLFSTRRHMTGGVQRVGRDRRYRALLLKDMFSLKQLERAWLNRPSGLHAYF